jgi:hypothetical protein
MILADVRAGLVVNLNALKTGYRDMQISPYELSSPTLPVIWVKPTPGSVIEYHQTFATMSNTGQETWSFTIQAFVASGGDVAAQMLLDELLNSDGAHSLKAAVEADKTLGGACDDLIVRRVSSYQTYASVVDGGICIGAEWIVEVS